MTVKEKIQSWLDNRQKALAEKYKAIEPYGIFSKDENWPDLLDNKLIDTGKGYSGQITGPYYTYWLEHGRGPTVNPTPHNPTVRQVVLRWLKKYNIQDKYGKRSQETVAYFISHSIHQKGIKVPGKYNPGGLVSDVLTDASFKQLLQDVGLLYSGEIKSDIIKQFKA